jgi:type I restriction enzyme S subunit
MTELPQGWKWTTLGSIADVVGGITKDSKKQTAVGLVEVPYLRVANVQRGYLDLSRVTRIHVAPAKAAQLALRPGDVLLNEGGDRNKLGRGWVWEGQIPDCIHQNHVFRARIRHDVLDPRLLSWYANDVDHRWFEINGSQSVNLASISLSKIKTFPIPVPPVAEQRRIMEVLDDHFSRLDVARRMLEAVQIRLARMQDAIVVEELRNADIAMVCLRSLLAEPLINGRSVPTRNDGFPVLRLTALKGDRLNLNERKGGDWNRDDAKSFLVAKGDFFVSRGNGSLRLVGRGSLLDKEPDQEIAFPDTMIRIRPDQTKVDSSYLSLIWNSAYVRQQIESGARTTAGIYKINQKLLESLAVPCVALGRQRAIAARIEEQALIVNMARIEVVKAHRREQHLRGSLLSAAFAGKLAAQDSADEPISVLLARIAARTEVDGEMPRRRTGKTAPTHSIAPSCFVQEEITL